MTRPSFAEGVAVALAAALAASVLSAGLGLLLPWGEVAPLICVGLGLGYGLYLLARSGQRVGRLVLVVAWVVVSFTVGALFGGIWPQVLTQLALVWLARTLYYHATPTAALLDAGLLLLGCSAAVWAFERTGSLFLTIWTLLLVQASFVLIAVGRTGGDGQGPATPPFDAAERTAERALRRLSPKS